MGFCSNLTATTEEPVFNILKLATRNLFRYKRRTLLTSMLITLGVVAVLMFVAITGSFKSMMVGTITDSMIGHLQIHKKGYLASVDSLPLDRNMTAKQIDKVTQILDAEEAIEAYSMRIRLGAMFSNFAETTNIRLNAASPTEESKTAPLLTKRIIEGDSSGLLKQGEILVPELIATGMKVKVGDGVVLVANNKDGSVNGQTLVVRGVLEGITGPGGRDGMIHIDDARSLLRIGGAEVSEIAIRLKDIDQLSAVYSSLKKKLGSLKNKKDKPIFEIHTWQKITPFSNLAKMIDLMTLFVKIMLVSIVLVSIMNVMIMAVYERINEIGTISAIGTRPNKILSLFVAEGLLLGILGTAIGTVISLMSIAIMNATQISFSWGRQTDLLLSPTISGSDVVITVATVIGIAVIASLQPAWKAAKMDPITALRHV
jgi:putative ABC transport system permease protein